MALTSQGCCEAFMSSSNEHLQERRVQSILHIIILIPWQADQLCIKHFFFSDEEWMLIIYLLQFNQKCM